jgi:hypothetical protein
MDSFDLVRIREIWKRLFGIDVEKKRRAAGLSSVAGHLRQFEKLNPKATCADGLLAEIEATGKIAKGGTFKKWHRFPPKPESKEPGITTGDVFRIFGNGARTTLTKADWLEIPESDRQAITEEAARCVFNGGVFFNDGQWRRANVTSARPSPSNGVRLKRFTVIHGGRC